MGEQRCGRRSRRDVLHFGAVLGAAGTAVSFRPAIAFTAQPGTGDEMRTIRGRFESGAPDWVYRPLWHGQPDYRRYMIRLGWTLLPSERLLGPRHPRRTAAAPRWVPDNSVVAECYNGVDWHRLCAQGCTDTTSLSATSRWNTPSDSGALSSAALMADGSTFPSHGGSWQGVLAALVP